MVPYQYPEVSGVDYFLLSTILKRVFSDNPGIVPSWGPVLRDQPDGYIESDCAPLRIMGVSDVEFVDTSQIEHNRGLVPSYR